MRSIWWTVQLEVRGEICFIFQYFRFYVDLEFKMIEAEVKEEVKTPAGDDNDEW